MRHKYTTEALVLARYPLKEAGMLTALLTKEFGLIHARVEGVRRSGAKLAHALQTLRMSEVSLVRGKEGWRLTGASLREDYFADLTQDGRTCAARVSGLLQRLLGKDIRDTRAYDHFFEFVDSLRTLETANLDASETLVALRLLNSLGVDAGELPPEGYTANALAYATDSRKALVERINQGIFASGL